MAAALPNDIKAKVTAALLAGGGVNAVSRDLGVPKATVSRIKNGLASEQLEHIETVKKTGIQELIVNYLSANLAALEAQANHSTKPEWLSKQSADQLAILHGVMADKAIRILEAAAAAEPLPDQTEKHAS